MKSEISEALREAVGEYNAGIGEGADPLEFGPKTALIGGSTTIDSFGLVTLIMAFEQAIEDRLGLSVELADDRALHQEKSPYRSLGTLEAYATDLIEQGAS
jgi:D-alanine--poly(phosphoribitol) ligase subunit 2